MANLETAQDIIRNALFVAGENATGDSDLDAQAVIYCNRAYRSIINGGGELEPGLNEDWWWAKGEANIILEPALTTGTASVTNNNASVTLSANATQDYSTWFFKVSTHPDIFQISTLNSGAAAVTLDSVYTGSTATAASFKIFKTDYDLATDSRKVISPMQAYQAARHKIYQTTLDGMQDRWPRGDIAEGVPERFAPVDENTIRFNRYGSATGRIRLDYDYVRVATDLTNATTSTPMIPRQYRQVLSDFTAFFFLMDKDELQKAEGLGLQARQGLRAMAKQNRVRYVQAGKQGHIHPRMREIKRGVIKTQEEGVIIG